MADKFEYEDLIGKPFEYGGRGPDKYDCYGLLREMFRRAGKDVPDYHSPDNGPEIMAKVLEEQQNWTEVEQQPGVAILIRLRGNAHVAYMLPYGMFIHTWDRCGGVTVERMRDWENRVVAYYDYI